MCCTTVMSSTSERVCSRPFFPISHESATPKGRIHPVVRFETADGRQIVSRSDQHHNVQPGDTLQVIYDPRNPADVEITTLSRANNRRLLFTVLSVAVGLVVCGLAFGIDIRKWRARTKTL